MKHHVLATLTLLAIGATLSCTSAAAQALPKSADDPPLPPIYTLHDSQVASAFAEGMTFTNSAGTAVLEYWVETGAWPTSNDEAKFSPSLDAKSPVQSVSIGPGGTITVLFNCLVAELCRKSAVLSPIGDNTSGKVQFTCTASEIPLIY
jgi:hypothetical protein